MVSLAPFVLRRPWLTKMMMPAASWYANAAGYRKLGLRYERMIFPVTISASRGDGLRYD